MRREPESIAYCCLAVLVALYVVGAVSHGSLRHEVQTLPLWIPIVLGFQKREIAKWCALPCLIFWLAIMVLIWVFLLGWARVVSGTFSPVEIAMTVVIGLACGWGIFMGSRWRKAVRIGAELDAMVLLAGLQVLLFRLSLIPVIARQ